MTKQTKTVLQLLAEKQAAQDAVMNADAAMRQVPFYRDIVSIATDFGFESEAGRLVVAIQDRESPLSREEIRAVFVASGFDFDESHVDACNPDSDKTIKKFVSDLNWSMR